MHNTFPNPHGVSSRRNAVALSPYHSPHQSPTYLSSSSLDRSSGSGGLGEYDGYETYNGVALRRHPTGRGAYGDLHGGHGSMAPEVYLCPTQHVPAVIRIDDLCYPYPYSHDLGGRRDSMRVLLPASATGSDILKSLGLCSSSSSRRNTYGYGYGYGEGDCQTKTRMQVWVLVRDVYGRQRTVRLGRRDELGLVLAAAGGVGRRGGGVVRIWVCPKAMGNGIDMGMGMGMRREWWF
ncbi:MAG: hypothetical protein M1832_001313 [Thelocarpon impressellum]|nr:MAG: hypothetical protein M1832_001313 [Thelocarpon impressellum]